MYPIIYNGHSKQYMPIPKRANLPKADNPVDWDSYKRAAYIFNTSILMVTQDGTGLKQIYTI